MIKIAPSILTWDFTELGRTLRIIEKAGIDRLHLDIMDGHFVPNITFGPAVVKSIRDKTGMFLDAHLMIKEPEKFIDDFTKSGADMITVHVETIDNIDKTIGKIKKKGLKAGVTLNPETGLGTIKNHLSGIDKVLLMTVHPGFGGQKFIKTVLPKLRKLKEIIIKKNLDIDIEVDGGINLETARLVLDAGANILVAGNYIYSAENMGKAIRLLKKTMKEYE